MNPRAGDGASCASLALEPLTLKSSVSIIRGETGRESWWKSGEDVASKSVQVGEVIQDSVEGEYNLILSARWCRWQQYLTSC